MTTSWALATHGRLSEAVQTHVTGTLAAAGAAVVAMGALVVAASGRRLAWRPGDAWLAAFAVGFAFLVVCEWLARLAWQSGS